MPPIGAFRQDATTTGHVGAPAAEFTLTDLRTGGPCLLTLPDGEARPVADPGHGSIALLEAMVGAVVAGLYQRGVLAVHAGAAQGPRGAIVVAGRSGQGKSTLILGLVRRGLGLLSDELALLDPAAGLVHPYPRAIHVRPATIGLLPELAPLEGRPRHELGGGSEWSVAPTEIADLLGGRLGDAAPLAGSSSSTACRTARPRRASATRSRPWPRSTSSAAPGRHRPISAPPSRPSAGCWPTSPASGCPSAGSMRPSTHSSPTWGSPMAEPTRDPQAVALLGLYQSYRETGKTLWLDTRGTSMRPLVGPGGRMLVEFGMRPSQVGDIVLFERAGTVVAHRVVGRRERDGRERLIVKGDNEAYFDPPIGQSDVLGIVLGLKGAETAPLVQRGVGGRSARVIAGVSRWTGRGARVAHRFAVHTPDPIRGAALRAIPSLARVSTRLIVAPITQEHGAGRR